MSLSSQDLDRLTRILQLGRELETAWPQGERTQVWQLTESTSHGALYQSLKQEIAKCAEADAESLRRLVTRSEHLHDSISLSHFYSCLVPFERLSSRALRDDEFLLSEGDDTSASVERVPLKLIVENVRSAFNVGALFRTSECLGVSEILLAGYTPGPDDGKTVRTAMGTANMVLWSRVDRAVKAFELLRQQGYQIIALETAAHSKSLYEIDFAFKPTAFVVGNERFGLDADTLRAADSICRIPLRGIKNSMNVGIAFGISAFEWLRQYEISKGSFADEAGSHSSIEMPP